LNRERPEIRHDLLGQAEHSVAVSADDKHRQGPTGDPREGQARVDVVWRKLGAEDKMGRPFVSLRSEEDQECPTISRRICAAEYAIATLELIAPDFTLYQNVGIKSTIDVMASGRTQNARDDRARQTVAVLVGGVGRNDGCDLPGSLVDFGWNANGDVSPPIEIKMPLSKYVSVVAAWNAKLKTDELLEPISSGAGPWFL
jgi:hypothetical protein